MDNSIFYITNIQGGSFKLESDSHADVDWEFFLREKGFMKSSHFKKYKCMEFCSYYNTESKIYFVECWDDSGSSFALGTDKSELINDCYAKGLKVYRDMVEVYMMHLQIDKLEHEKCLRVDG